MASLFGPLLTLAMSLPVAVSGEGDCPSAVAVENALRPLLATTDASEREQVRLSRRKGRVAIEMVGKEGAPPVVREIDGNASCADLARTVAVIVAAWQLERHPDQRKEEPSPAPTAPSPAAPPPKIAAPPLPSEQRLQLELGLGAALAFEQASPEAVLRTGLMSPSGWGGALWGGGPRGHTEALLGGSVEWFRPVLAAALLRRAKLGSAIDLDVSLGPAAAWVQAHATNLTGARRVSSWSPGVTAGARMSYGYAYGVWLAIDGCRWLRTTRLAVEPAAGSVTLPRWEMWAGAGLFIRWPSKVE